MGVSTETVLPESEIKIKKAIFHLKELYKHTKDWLDEKGYDTIEKKYEEKIEPSGRELTIEWKCEKKIDEYSRFVIKIKWKTLGMNDIKLKQDGKEVKMQQGELNVKVSAELELDYNEKWDSSPIVKLFQSFYEKYLYVGTITEMKSKLWEEGWKCYNEIKSYLNLYKYQIR